MQYNSIEKYNLARFCKISARALHNLDGTFTLIPYYSNPFKNDKNLCKGNSVPTRKSNEKKMDLQSIFLHTYSLSSTVFTFLSNGDCTAKLNLF
jgi:hypothetical protein